MSCNKFKEVKLHLNRPNSNFHLNLELAFMTAMLYFYDQHFETYLNFKHD